MAPKSKVCGLTPERFTLSFLNVAMVLTVLAAVAAYVVRTGVDVPVSATSLVDSIVALTSTSTTICAITAILVCILVGALLLLMYMFRTDDRPLIKAQAACRHAIALFFEIAILYIVVAFPSPATVLLRETLRGRIRVVYVMRYLSWIVSNSRMLVALCEISGERFITILTGVIALALTMLAGLAGEIAPLLSWQWALSLCVAVCGTCIVQYIAGCALIKASNSGAFHSQQLQVCLWVLAALSFTTFNAFPVAYLVVQLAGGGLGPVPHPGIVEHPAVVSARATGHSSMLTMEREVIVWAILEVLSKLLLSALVVYTAAVFDFEDGLFKSEVNVQIAAEALIGSTAGTRSVGSTSALMPAVPPSSVERARHELEANLTMQLRAAAARMAEKHVGLDNLPQAATSGESGLSSAHRQRPAVAQVSTVIAAETIAQSPQTMHTAALVDESLSPCAMLASRKGVKVFLKMSPVTGACLLAQEYAPHIRLCITAMATGAVEASENGCNVYICLEMLKVSSSHPTGGEGSDSEQLWRFRCSVGDQGEGLTDRQTKAWEAQDAKFISKQGSQLKSLFSARGAMSSIGGFFSLRSEEGIGLTASAELLLLSPQNGGFRIASALSSAELSPTSLLAGEIKSLQPLPANAIIDDSSDLIGYSPYLFDEVTIGPDSEGETSTSTKKVHMRTLSFLFIDIKGSTNLYEDLGDATAITVVHAVFDLIAKIVSLKQGCVVKTIGDCVMAVFDSSEAAISAGVDIQYELLRQGLDVSCDSDSTTTHDNDEHEAPESGTSSGTGLRRRFTWKRSGFSSSASSEDPTLDLRLKVGMSSGPAMAVSSRGQLDYFGSTVNMAARAEGQCEGADIVFPSVVHQKSPQVRELLAKQKLETTNFEAKLKGFAGVSQLARVRIRVE